MILLAIIAAAKGPQYAKMTLMTLYMTDPILYMDIGQPTLFIYSTVQYMSFCDCYSIKCKVNSVCRNVGVFRGPGNPRSALREREKVN